jgi:energy-coupling factor transporter ATP-binding protein EcfA2
MKLKLQHVGPIAEADLTFGDLTVLVGPQASGKSIALQMLKLVLDTASVQDIMKRYGLDWSGAVPEFFDAYFGEGMRGIWNDRRSTVSWEGRAVDMSRRARGRRGPKRESLFYIPAQRVLALRDGWPRPFLDYSPGVPFVVCDFGENLRLLVEKELGASKELFPQERRLTRDFREMLDRSVFKGFRLRMDKVRPRRRLVLGATQESLPFMVWSAGQREFVPLLLGLYWLMPPGQAARRRAIDWVVLEELEMGLHPRAITVVLLMVFGLVARGYRVCISTHSPQVLEAVWALRQVQASRAPAPTRALLRVFDAPYTPKMRKIARIVLRKNVQVYYFDGATGRARDISSLDLDDEESGGGGWGGLTEFSGRANAVVADAAANADGEGQA